ncbi:unnamed protein product [Schistosoma margrebowiei]|uniref:Uncharacterized protein n=1 Tax=Schistosoma margrebowiei TaxID=48269 RepID=A0A3P7XPT2_9TREM|nr:unnamed protein product [Schistosoma margrebowiei]
MRSLPDIKTVVVNVVNIQQKTSRLRILTQQEMIRNDVLADDFPQAVHQLSLLKLDEHL